MNIEELKLVLQTVQGIGGDARSAAIWWMALHYGTETIKYLSLMGTLLGAVYGIRRVLVGDAEWRVLAQGILAAYGHRDSASYVTADARRAAQRAIEKAHQGGQ